MTNSTVLPIAQVVIYALFSIPTLYILLRHGKSGFLGWLYLLIYCVLRITGNALFLHDPSSTGATIIVSIGISPLLLALLGILHEARARRNPHLMPHLEVPLVTALHFLVATAIALVAAGASALAQPNPKPSSLVIVKVGIVILLLSWFIIVMVGAISLLDRQDRRKSNQTGAAKTKQYNSGTKLLFAVLACLLLAGIRVLYSVVTIFQQSAALNPVTGGLALRVCLSVVPEMLVVAILVAIGLYTQDVGRK